MSKMQAYCGLDCGACEAYLATQSGDPAALEAVVVKWQAEYSPDITLDAVACDGCLSDSGRLCSYCGQCPIRACARERQVANCAQCNDYGCEIVQGFFEGAPHMKPVLDGMRQEWLAGRA